jgi:hypothetical protein
MTSLRFPLMLGVALALGAAAAHAQSAPAGPPATATVPQTKVEDIEVAQAGDTVSILVKLSGQPTAASAVAAGDQLKLEIDGISLVALNLSPPAGSLVRSVTAAKGEIVLGGVALSAPDVVIYRHAVLVKARLAEPADINGASLMSGTAPVAAGPTPLPVATKPIPVAPAQPIPVPVVAAPAAPALAPAAVPVTPPEPVAPAPPITPKPQPAPEHPPEAPTPDDVLQSAPAPAAPAAGPVATLAGIDAARCAAAKDELAKDSWALGAMGDVALCLIDADKPDEARARLDQLGAITPQDWRVSLGRAVLETDAAIANGLFLAASLGAPNDTVRSTIITRIKPETFIATAAGPAPAAEADLQIPLPK